MFKSRTEGSVVFKCTVRLLEELDVLECEFQVGENVVGKQYIFGITQTRTSRQAELFFKKKNCFFQIDLSIYIDFPNVCRAKCAAFTLTGQKVRGRQ